METISDRLKEAEGKGERMWAAFSSTQKNHKKKITQQKIVCGQPESI